MFDYRKAWDKATKEGDRHMRCRGGTEWNKDDLLAADEQLLREWGAINTTLYNQLKGSGQAAGNETG